MDLEKSFEVNKLKLKISYIQLKAIPTYPLVFIWSHQVLATLVTAFEEVRKHFIIKAEKKSEQRRSLSVCLRYASYLWNQYIGYILQGTARSNYTLNSWHNIFKILRG